jgi:hypothetical protein
LGADADRTTDAGVGVRGWQVCEWAVGGCSGRWVGAVVGRCVSGRWVGAVGGG